MAVTDYKKCRQMATFKNKFGIFLKILEIIELLFQITG